jgi:SH3 domain-containing YSC84-like protein 1
MNRELWVKVSCVAALSAVTVLAADEKQSEVSERLSNANVAFGEIMGTPDKGIPAELLAKAECAILIPGMKKGAFIVGAKYGKGFITCRSGNASGWSAPGNVRVEGGSIGPQIGGGEVDVFLLVMNKAGVSRILKSEFKIGGEASVMAGPVGRSSSAQTDAYMRAQMLGWSRARGAFAGLALAGSTLREDMDDNRALYGREISNEQIVMGNTRIPAGAEALLHSLHKASMAGSR